MRKEMKMTGERTAMIKLIDHLLIIKNNVGTFDFKAEKRHKSMLKMIGCLFKNLKSQYLFDIFLKF